VPTDDGNGIAQASFCMSALGSVAAILPPSLKLRRDKPNGSTQVAPTFPHARDCSGQKRDKRDETGMLIADGAEVNSQKGMGLV